MKTTDVGLSMTLKENVGGSLSLVAEGDHNHTFVYLGSRETALPVVRAILAALGEPVEEKPDRSELDYEESIRYAVLSGELLVGRWSKSVPVDRVIEASKAATSNQFGVYELIAFVGPKPELERKVVRLD